MPIGERPLILVANRLPVSRDTTGWRPATGGLVTALRPAIEASGGAWVGWDEDAAGVPRRVEGLGCDLHAVALDPDEVEGYYHGFANRTIWPLFHDVIAQPVIERSWWRTYEEVSRRFATTVAAIVAASPRPPVLWVQDYHLLLLPRMLRELVPDVPIGFFLHTPFPAPELFARLPWRERLLDGLLAADNLGFQTSAHRDNFLRTVQRVVRDARVLGDTVVLPDGHRARAVAHPISIDVDDFSRLATDRATEADVAELAAQFGGRRVFLGIDRLDYTKGIRHRLRSLELLLEEDPGLADRVVLVQIAVPSRDDVSEYQQLRGEVESEVGRINGRFTAPGRDVPVHYLYRSIDRQQLAAYYRLADVMCVTPLKDGMNLVAKEFVTVQDAAGGSGVLLLSEFCGTAQEFGDDAVRCNPFDVEGMSMLMAGALGMQESDRRARLQRMAQRVRDHDVHRWVETELDVIVGRRRRP